MAVFGQLVRQGEKVQAQEKEKVPLSIPCAFFLCTSANGEIFLCFKTRTEQQGKALLHQQLPVLHHLEKVPWQPELGPS